MLRPEFLEGTLVTGLEALFHRGHERVSTFPGLESSTETTRQNSRKRATMSPLS
jgi:hypothetical protein